MVSVDESQLLEYYYSLVNHADVIKEVLLLYRTWQKSVWTRGDLLEGVMRNVFSGEWLSPFKCDAWAVLEGNTDIWNGRELLCTLSRSSIWLRFPQGKHGDLTSRLVHQRQDNLEIMAY